MSFGMRQNNDVIMNNVRNINVIMNNVKNIIAETGPDDFRNDFRIRSGPLTARNTVGIPPVDDRPYIDMYTYKDSIYTAFACVPPEFARLVRNLPPCDKFKTNYFYRPRPEKMNAVKNSAVTNNIYSMSLMIAGGMIDIQGNLSNLDIPDNVFIIPTLRAALTAAYNHKIPIRHIGRRCGEWKNDYPIFDRYKSE